MSDVVQSHRRSNETPPDQGTIENKIDEPEAQLERNIREELPLGPVWLQGSDCTHAFQGP